MKVSGLYTPLQVKCYRLVLWSLYEFFEASKWSMEDRKLSDFIKKIFICVLKMNVSGLERHEGEQIIFG